jgi:ribosomal protein S12 methylthiotransferase accessory factor
LDRLAAGPAGALRTRFLHLGTGDSLAEQVGVTVIAAVVSDRTTGYLALGAAAGTDPEATALKAFGEALQLQLLLADYDDPDGALARAAAHPGSPLRPWRADRAYTRSYRPDLRDVHDYGCHLQLHLDPAAQRRFEAELIDATTGSVTLDDLSTAAPAHPHTAAGDAHAGTADPVAAALGERGHRPVVVDLTTDDIRACGLRVVRVVVPGLYGNAAAGRPFLGGRRLPEQLARHGSAHRAVPLPH